MGHRRPGNDPSFANTAEREKAPGSGWGAWRGGGGGGFAVITRFPLEMRAEAPTRSRGSMANVPGIHLVVAMQATAGSGVRLHKWVGGIKEGACAETAVNQPPRLG